MWVSRLIQNWGAREEREQAPLKLLLCTVGAALVSTQASLVLYFHSQSLNLINKSCSLFSFLSL